MWDGEALLRARAAVASRSSTVAAAVARLEEDAAKAFLVKPLSVTSKPSPPVGGDLHDYTSYSSYGWPCTATCNRSLFANCSAWTESTTVHCNASTGLPWRTHDGYNDPESAQDRPRLSAMMEAVEALSASAFFLNNSQHASRAALLLRVWFLNEATFMRPNARFAQAPNPGAAGTGGGIIDFSDGAFPGGGGSYIASISLAHMLDSVSMLAWAAPDAWTADDMAGLQKWVVTWLNEWLMRSPGNADRHAKNNHADWDTLTATCAFFVGNISVVHDICNAAPERIASQVATDGRLPAEERRTKSESYHAFALTALMDLALLCRAAAPESPNLFSYTTADGRSLLSALNWLAPYAQGKRWDAGRQIIPFSYYDPGHEAFVTIYRAAAIGLPGHSARFAGVASQQPDGTRSRQVLLRGYGASALE